MHKLTSETMKGAIERAKAERMRVRVLSVDGREFAVTNTKNGKTYTVRFVVVGGNKLGQCDCAARTVCKHIASAASVNIAVQAQREANPTPGESKAYLARNVGWCI